MDVVPDYLELIVDKYPYAIPLYSVTLSNHLNQLKDDFAHLDGLGIFGNYTGKLSIRNMAESAHTFVESI